MGLVLNPTYDSEPTPAIAGPSWNFLQRLAFRFTLAYLVLYILPFPVGQLDALLHPMADPFEDQTESFLAKWVEEPHRKAWDKAVLWTGEHIFEKEITYRPRGSGDTTWNYVQVLLFAVFAGAIALIWTLAASLRARLTGKWRFGYPVLHEWLRVYVRFYLAYQMFTYGTVKVIKAQFASVPANGLLDTYGESSPMHLLWTFMGSSDAYNWFAGAGEMLGGFLLCFRRTTLLGSLVTFGVMLHVAVLNFCYDVPVKLFSSHLVLMSVFVMIPDLPWLTGVFVLGRRQPPRPIVPLTRWAWLNAMLIVFRTVVVGAILVLLFHGADMTSKKFGDRAPQPPLGGFWEVDSFSIDGKERPPLATDRSRWDHVAIVNAVKSPAFAAYPVKGQGMYYPAEIDEEKKTITLSRFSRPDMPPPPKFVFTYQEVGDGVIELDGELELYVDGQFGKKKVHAKLRHLGDDRFLLKSRGFHWVNELPLNMTWPRDRDFNGWPPEQKKG
jgi:hypothetical protein